MVLKELILTVSTLGDVIILKEQIPNSFYFRRYGGLERTGYFNSPYLGGMWLA